MLATIDRTQCGVIQWLNGHDIARHWEIGRQREFFLPECWLKFGEGQKNVIVTGLRQTVNGAKLNALEISPYPDSTLLSPVHF